MTSIRPLAGLFAGVVGSAANAVSGQANIFRSWFTKDAQSDQETFEQYQTVYDSVVKTIYAFYLNPLVSGAPIPELSDDNIFSAFEEDPFVPTDLFDPLLRGEDTLRVDQLRNMGRRLIFQARAVVDLVHMQGLSPIGDDTREELKESLRRTAASWRRVSQSDAAYYAFFAELLVVLRVGLTFTYAIIATMRRMDAVKTRRIPRPADEAGASDDAGEVVESYIAEFPSVLREAIKSYKLEEFVDFIIERASTSIVNPMRDTSNEVSLGRFGALAPTLNALNATLRSIGLSDASGPDVPLLIGNEEPFDLRPNVIVGQLVNMLNFHASYGPRMEFVVQNSVLEEYAQLERAFDGSIAVSDPNTRLIRAFMFVEVAVVEDWSLFCRLTGLFAHQPGEAVPANERPESRYDAEYPSTLPNDGQVATVYWRTAWRSIRGFVDVASPESVLSVLNAFVSVQQFHAGTGFPATTISTRTELFNARVPVQDEAEPDAIWRTTAQPGISVVRVPNAPSRELVYGTSDALFKSMFVEPSPYEPDDFKIDRTHRASQFFQPENIELLLRTVAATLYQCILVAFNNDILAHDMSVRVIELYERITQPYDTRNRAELSIRSDRVLVLLDDLLDASRIFVPDADNRVSTNGRPRKGVLTLFELGVAIVNMCLISSIRKGQKLVYPPAVADVCMAWIELYTKAFDRAVFVKVSRIIPDSDPEARETVFVDKTQKQDQDTLVGNSVGNIFVTFVLDNSTEDLDNAFTRITLATDQLVQLKELFDPTNQLVLAMIAQNQRLETEYMNALINFSALHSEVALQRFSAAASALAQYGQSLEMQYANKADVRLLAPIAKSKELLAAYPPLVQVRSRHC